MRGEGRVRLHPRMSTPKLSEYLDAPAHRRQQILRDQKCPPEFKVVRYAPAAEAIRRAILRGGNVADCLLQSADRLREKAWKSEFERQSISCSVAAVQQFAALYPRLGLENAQATFVGHRGLYQRVRGVAISSFPLVLLRSKHRGAESTGALLVVFRKDKELGKHGGCAAGELLRGALEMSGLVDPGTIKAELCVVVDLFGDAVYHAPRSRKRLRTEVESACEEIATLWPFVGKRAA